MDRYLNKEEELKHTTGYNLFIGFLWSVTLSILIVAAIVYLCWPKNAHAEPAPQVQTQNVYVTLGYGKSVLNHNGQDNLWYQSRFDYREDEKSHVGQVGIGFKVTNWMNAEITYHDFGTYNLSSVFVTPDEMYQPQTLTGCADGSPCPEKVRSVGIGTAKGVSFTVLPEFGNRTAGAFARLGAIYFDARYHQYMREAPNYDCTIDAMQDDGGMNKKGVSAVYGAGLRWTPFKGHDLTAEYVTYPMVRGHLSAFNSVQTKTINYRYWF